MKKTTKWLIDVAMTAAMIFLMSTTVTGVALHEWLGLGLFLLFVIHHILNFAFVRRMSRNLFNPDVKGRARGMYLLDAVLLFLVLYLGVSGVMISQTIFPYVEVTNEDVWSVWHHFAAYLALVLISVHIGLHGNAVMAGMRRLLHLKAGNGLRKWVVRIVALGVAALGVRAMTMPDIYTKFTDPFTYMPLGDSTDDTVATTASITQSVDTEHKQQALTVLSVGAEAAPTLEEYLSKLYCTGCSKHCPLSSPRCGKGETRQSAAIQEYNAQYAAVTEAPTTTTTATQAATEAPTTATEAPVSSEKAEATPATTTTTTTTTTATTTTTTLPATSNDLVAVNPSGVLGEDPESWHPLNMVEMMGLVVLGTHYTVTYATRRRK